jgi:RNA polymerase sigma-70 factor, ECF subfamily
MTEPDFTAPFELAKAGRRERSQPAAIEEQRVIELFDELRRPLLRYLAALGLPFEEGEEVVQETFLALFEHLRREKSGNLRGWLFRVAHNLGLKRRLARKREVFSAAFDSLAAARPDVAGNPEEQFLAAQRQERFEAGLRALPEQDRCCLALRAEGLRYREIAQVLGMSLGSVSASLARSLERLGRAATRA